MKPNMKPNMKYCKMKNLMISLFVGILVWSQGVGAQDTPKDLPKDPLTKDATGTLAMSNFQWP